MDGRDPLDQFLVDAAAPAATAEAEPDVARERPQAGQVVYHLLVPLRVAGEPLDKVSLRLPDLDEVQRLGSGEIATPRDLLAELCGLPVPVLRRLAAPDAEMLIGIFDLMVPGGR